MKNFSTSQSESTQATNIRRSLLHLAASVLAVFCLANQLAAQTYPTPGFTLPAGKSITITYEVDVNAEACEGGVPTSTLIVNQATVSGSNFANVLTDTLPAAGAKDPTTTPIGSQTLGNLVFNDVNRNGVFDAGDSGIDGVVVNLYDDGGADPGFLDATDNLLGTTTTVGGGLYSFAVCPGDYIVEVAASNFTSGGALYNGGAPFVTSPTTTPPDPNDDVNNDDNGGNIAGFGVAAFTITLDYDMEPTDDGDASDDTNLSVDFGFKTPTTVSIADNSASESAGVLNLTVTRNDNSDAFSLTVNTTTGTATSSDFTEISGGTVSFTAGGSLTATIAVTLNNENIVEANETFTVTLSDAPAGVVITTATATGTINNDDAATVTLSAPASQLEGNAGTTTYTFTLTLDNPVQGGFMIMANLNTGTATFVDGDFNGPSVGHNFTGNAGETKTMTANINGDEKVELNENFSVSLDAPTGAPAGVTTAGTPLTATITNDDSATISFSGSVSQSEATTPQAFTVNLTNAVDVDVTVEVATTDASATTADSDYSGATMGQMVTFLAGTTTSQTVNIAIGNDNKVEANEQYTLGLSNVSAMGRSVSITPPSLVTGTIENDDNATVTLAAAITEDDEGNSGTFNRIFTATLNNPVQGGFNLAFTTDDGTATLADNDYVNNDNSLTFSGTANEIETITVLSNGDLNIEDNETFSVTLGAISGTTLGGSISLAGSPKMFTLINDEKDWGDAPTAMQSGFADNYPTMNADDGANHLTAPGGLRLGASIDVEINGQPTANADGDGADEDGVTLPAQLLTGFNSSITVNSSGTGKLDAWVDFDQDGFWDETTEKVITNANVVAGNNSLSFAVPGTASTGTSFARFRLSTAGNLISCCMADDGEVEDYQVTVIDNSLSINDVTVTEGASGTVTASFTVSLSAPAPAGGVTFDIATQNNSASSVDDYVAKSLTGQSIPMGSQTYTFDVLVNGDLIVEDNETFFVNVTNVTGVGVGDGQGVGTIENDDTATLTFSGGDSQGEPQSPRAFNATLNAVVQGGFQIAYTTNNGTTNPATASSDYTDNDSELTFAGSANETQTVNVIVANESLVELDETFTVVLGAFSMTSAEQISSISIVNGTQTETILNDDGAVVNLDPTTLSQAEGAGNQVRTVTLSNPVDVDVTVAFTASDNTALDSDNDYEPIINQTVTFPAGTTTSQNVTVTVNNDFKVEPDEIFNVTINNLMAMGRNVAIGAGTGSGTIANDDSATLTLTGGGSGNELNSGTSGKIFTATLDNPVQGGFTLNFTSNDGSATTGDSDYADNDGAIGFTGTANEMQTITVNVNGDHAVEADETFTVNMNSLSNTSLGSSITLAGSPQTWTILNDEIDFGDAPTSAQSGFTHTYKTELPDSAARHRAVFGVHLGATIDGEDNGQPTASANGDDNTFLDDEDGVTLPASFITNTTQTITVNASVAGFIHGWIDWNRNGYWNFAEQVLANVPVAMGNNTFNISTPAGASVGTSFARFRFTPVSTPGLSPITNPDVLFASLPVGEVEDYQVLIQNTTLSINDVTQVETNAGTTTFAFTVSLNNPAPAGGVTFDIATQDNSATDANNDYEPNSLTGQTIPMGSSTYTFNVTVNGDAIVETNESFFVNVTNVTGVGVTDGQGLGTITNDDMATLTLSGGSSQTEGASHTFTATLSHAVQGGFTVAYTTNDGTAMTADSDYTDNDNTLTFSGNVNEMMTITVLTTTDNKVELDETFTVALGTPSAASITVSGSPQTGTITNDDSAVLAIAANVSQSEATSPQAFSLTLSNPVDVDITVEALTSDGTATNADSDYSPYFQMFSFPANSTMAQAANVTVNNDNKVEDHETYAFKLQNLAATGRSVTLGTDKTGTIQNDDSATITLTGSGSANEGNSGSTGVTFTATVDNPVQGGFTAFVTTANGTANGSSDFGEGNVNLVFNGSANQSIGIITNVNGDTDVEPDETFNFQFGSLVAPNTVQIVAPTTVQTNAIGTAGSPQTWTILNDDIDWGDAPDTYLTLSTSSGPSHGGSNLRLGTLNDGDVGGQPNPTGTGDDTDPDGDDEDGVTLPAQFIATTTANLTVNASATGKLDAWVDFNADGDFDLPGEQVFTNQSLVSGDNSLSFVMPASVTQGSSFARFRLSSAGNLGVGGAASDGEVEDYSVELVNTQFSINDTITTEGNAGTTNLTFTISRSTNGNNCSVDYAITGGTAVTTGTANMGGADYQTLASGTASFTAGGALSQTVSVVVNGDQTVELDETVVMTLSNPVGGNILDGSGTGTITNDDAATITITSPSITEGNSGTSNLTFTISMSNPADANVDFNFATGNGSATTVDNDYQVNSGTHTLAPGETSKMVDVAIEGDCKIEPDENFSLVLGSLNPNGRSVTFSGGNSTLTGTGTILNDDALPVITCPSDFSQNTDVGVCQATVTLPLPTTSSLCGSSTLEFRYRSLSNSIFTSWIVSLNNTVVFPKGEYEIEWQVTDGSGSSTCSHLLSVLDNEAPVAVCQNITVNLNAAGNVTVTPAQVDNGSSDNCSFSLSLSQTSFDCSHVGENMVNLTVTDPSGNSQSCTGTITVKDVTPPNAACVEISSLVLSLTGEASIIPDQVNDNSSDACGIQSMSVTPNAFTCSNLGANTVTLTVTDVNTNSATCTATVTVVDNLPPTVACQNISISLGANGYASITSPMVFNAAGSSDNCGMVNPQSVTPNVFDCSDIGANTVTLTANDGHGNTATCQATVTVAPFITNIQVTVTPAECNGSNGSITITAEALGGQLRFSIDNFVSFNLTGVFNNLSPGTYPVSVMAAGTSGCQVNFGNVTVGTTGTQQTWYKDFDNDDYSDGNSQVACSQPGGYQLAMNLIAISGDCNDLDSLQFPGQVWYKDQDNDGYSNGQTLVQCLKPVNYKAAVQLIQTSGDCNDTNGAIHPGATEVCNNIDDDCDGQVDEGVAGGLTWVGNVTLNSQTGAWNNGTGGVNNFPQCYSVIQGNLTIQNSTVNSLAALSNLVKVTGNVIIKLTSVVTMNGLHNMDTIGGDFTINNNNYGSKLQSLDGLEDLDWVNGNLKVYYNFYLTDCCAIEDLVAPEPNGTGGTVSIYSNAAGCNNVSQIIACPGFAGGGGNNNLIVTPDQPCPDCPSTATGENWQVMAFPNPANESLTVEIEGNFKQGTVGLTDLAGRELLRREVLEGETQVTLQLDEVRTGLYFLRVRSGEGQVQVIRVVVAK